MTIRTLAALAMLLLPSAAAFGQARDRDTLVRNDRKAFDDDTNWIYNDLAKGFDAAKESGKPMLVVFR